MQLKKFSQLTPGAAAAIEEHPRLMGLWDLVWPWVSETNAAVSYCFCAPVVLKGLLFPCSDFDGKGMSGFFCSTHQCLMRDSKAVCFLLCHYSLRLCTD